MHPLFIVQCTNYPNWQGRQMTTAHGCILFYAYR